MYDDCNEVLQARRGMDMHLIYDIGEKLMVVVMANAKLLWNEPDTLE